MRRKHARNPNKCEIKSIIIFNPKYHRECARTWQDAALPDRNALRTNGKNWTASACSPHTPMVALCPTYSTSVSRIFSVNGADLINAHTQRPQRATTGATQPSQARLSRSRTIARTLQWWRRLVSVNLEEHNMQFSDSSSGTQSPDSETFFERRLASMRQPEVTKSAWFTLSIVPREPVVTILLTRFTHHCAKCPCQHFPRTFD